MKIQDVGFLLTLITLILFRRERAFLIAGLLCFIAAIPLYARWVFFTAERLVWYAGAFILIYNAQCIMHNKYKNLEL